MPSFSWESSTPSISLPSVTNSALQLLAQILSMGETEDSGGLETTMTNMNELHNIFTLLGMNVKLCPKLSSSRLAMKAVPYGGTFVRDEVLMFEDRPLREMEAQNHAGLLIKKKSTTKKHSSRKFQQFLKKKENIMRNHFEDEKNVEESCDEFDSSCKVEEGFDDVKFKQSGLLQDFKVNLVECTSDATFNENAMSKKYVTKGERSLIMCNICGVEVNKYASLRRHYREKHGIQDEKPACKVKKPSVNKCQNCDKKFSFRSSLLKHFKRVHKNEILPEKRETGSERKVHHQEVLKSKDESAVCTNMEVMNNNCSSKRVECNECEASFHHNSSLGKHKRRFHEGKTYGCGVCDKIRAYRGGMLKHCSTSGHDKKLIYLIVDLP